MSGMDFKPWIEANFNSHLALLKRLAAIPAPSHNEDRRVEFLLDHLNKVGVHAYADAAKNVLIPMECDGESGITLISAHTDVVFPDTEPLPVCERDGKLFAPGVGDDTTKREVTTAAAGYIYWHWMYDVSYSTRTDRAISHRYGSWNYDGTPGGFLYKYFTAFPSSVNCPYLDNYYCCSQNLPSYNTVNEIANLGIDTTHVGTPRMFRFSYNVCNYIDYVKIFYFYKIDE